MVGGNGRGMAGRLGRALAFQFIVTQSVSQSFGRRGRASIGTSSGVYYFAVSGCWWLVACTWAKNKTILFYSCCGVPLQLYVDLVVGSDSQFGSKEQLCKKSSVLADWLSSGKVRSVYGSRVSELPTDRIESSSGAWLCY